MILKKLCRGTISKMIAIGVILLVAGCAAQKPEEDKRLVWPPPPDTARIKFLRTISSEEDLQEDTTFKETVFDFLAGGKPAPSQILEPDGLAVSDDGKVLYVSDRAQAAVFVFDFGNRKFQKIGGDLAFPMGVAVDSDANIYVVEQAKKAVTVFDPTGKEIRTITDSSLERPSGLAIDRERKRLYVADTAHTTSKEHTVKIFSLDGKLIGKIGGERGDLPGHFLFPTYVWVDSDGVVYVTDTLNCRVQAFSPTGEYLRSFGQRGDSWGQFSMPKGVALDTFHNVYVVDSAWSNVQIFNQKGQILLFFGGRGPIPGMLKNPTAMAIDKNNHIYVGDYLNHRIEEYQLVNTTSQDSTLESAPPAGTPSSDSKPQS